MIIKCAWCGDYIDTILVPNKPENGNISHGMCQLCSNVVIGNLEGEIEIYEHPEYINSYILLMGDTQRSIFKTGETIKGKYYGVGDAVKYSELPIEVKRKIQKLVKNYYANKEK